MGKTVLEFQRVLPGRLLFRYFARARVVVALAASMGLSFLTCHHEQRFRALMRHPAFQEHHLERFIERWRLRRPRYGCHVQFLEKSALFTLALHYFFSSQRPFHFTSQAYFSLRPRRRMLCTTVDLVSSTLFYQLFVQGRHCHVFLSKEVHCAGRQKPPECQEDGTGVTVRSPAASCSIFCENKRRSSLCPLRWVVLLGMPS